MTVRRIITNGGAFDSELGLPRLEDNRSDLTLIVRIHLRPVNPSGNAASGTIRDSGDRYSVVRWEAQKWADYCRRFENVCEMIWNDALYLLPPASLPAAVHNDLILHAAGASNQSPYIRCHLDIQITQQARGSHASLRCHCMAPSETGTFRSFIQQRSGRDTGVMTSEDVYLEPEFDGDNLRLFNAVAHEVGHVLGLEHPVCSGNGDRCYGTPLTPEHASVMGFGSNITLRQASPWLRRIRQHTNVRTGWQPTAQQPNQPNLNQLLGISP